MSHEVMREILAALGKLVRQVIDVMGLVLLTWYLGKNLVDML